MLGATEIASHWQKHLAVFAIVTAGVGSPSASSGQAFNCVAASLSRSCYSAQDDRPGV